MRFINFVVNFSFIVFVVDLALGRGGVGSSSVRVVVWRLVVRR